MSSGTSGWSAKHAPDILAQPWSLPVLETFELNGFKQRAFEYEDAFYNTIDDPGADNKDAKRVDSSEGVEGETPLDQKKNGHMDRKQDFEDKTPIINKAMYLRGNEGHVSSCHANILRRKLFARLGSMPSVRKVTLNDVVYSRGDITAFIHPS
ncbi:hypothetical protein BGZ82_000095 [Podila clonocystis]|nr:hypothetical protein BGZ82_000095 [Podila clonocystis]